MSLQTLYLMPTLECNCRCNYCYIPKGVREHPATPPDFAPVLEAFLMEATATPQLRFIGGEPLLLPETVSALTTSFCRARPTGLVVINTNGTLLDQEIIRPFQQFAGQTAWIVSLDGLHTIHNSRRRLVSGASAFDAAVAGITSLQEGGQRVLCNMVLDRESAAGMDALFRFLSEDLGMDSISVSLNSSQGSGLLIEEKIQLLQQAYRLGVLHGLSVSGHHRLLLGMRIPELRCSAGVRTLLFGPDRHVYPCQRFVGRIEGALWKPGDKLAALVDAAPVNDCCYTPETKLLGDGLHDFFQKEFPAYLQVNALDRLLFGVL